MRKTLYTKYGKRLLDIIISVVLLVILAPMILLVAIVIKMSDQGPVFFSQDRIGQNFKPFRMYKFRTMSPNATGSSLTSFQDQRVIKHGHFLRRSKLDEIPQFLNVIKGDMSIVGPRPETEELVRDLIKKQPDFFLVKPGVTGNASLAYIEEEQLLVGRKDKIGYYKKFILPNKYNMGVEYSKHISFWTDISIMFATLYFAMLLLTKNLGYNIFNDRRSFSRKTTK